MALVETAIDVARAMAHLHKHNIVHSDLKARNVLLRSDAHDPRGFTAKVADFGLSLTIDPNATHISNAFQVRYSFVYCLPWDWLVAHMRPADSIANLVWHELHAIVVVKCSAHCLSSCAACLNVWCLLLQGTMTHMAPETLMNGHISRSSDVFGFGILMWELFTGEHAYKGIPRALLGHNISKQGMRPMYPPDTPFEWQFLSCRCWESDPAIR
jgi:serine/threonine protein kinase